MVTSPKRLSAEAIIMAAMAFVIGVIVGGIFIFLGTEEGRKRVLFKVNRFPQRGIPVETRAELDVMINGDGFFRVQLAGGLTGYTRAGSLSVDREGRLITNNRYILTDNITVDMNRVSLRICHDGTIAYSMAGEEQSTQAGQLTLAKFPNPDGLRYIGDALYVQTDCSGDPIEGNPGDCDIGLGELQQGFLEEILVGKEPAWAANYEIVRIDG